MERKVRDIAAYQEYSNNLDGISNNIDGLTKKLATSKDIKESQLSEQASKFNKNFRRKLFANNKDRRWWIL